MRDVEHGNPTREFSLHLTLLSSDVIKSGAREASKISVSCDISEVPKVNCTIIFTRQNQDLGPIGSIKFSKNRPIASAFVNLPGRAKSFQPKIVRNISVLRLRSSMMLMKSNRSSHCSDLGAASVTFTSLQSLPSRKDNRE